MKKHLVIFLTLLTAVVVSKAYGQMAQDPQPKQTLMDHWTGVMRIVESIPLPTEGYMDHCAYDLKNNHLFISGENNKSLVVVDIKAGQVIHETKGLGGNPRKPFFQPSTNEVWLDLGNNTVVAIDGTTFEVTKTVELTGGKGATNRTPDNGAYDAAKGLFYVFVDSKNNEGSVEIVDTKAGKLVGSIKLEGNDPAGAAIEPDGSRLYVGMGDVANGQSIVKVIDTAKHAVVAEWPITGGPQPHVGGLDAVHHRLFMGSRLGSIAYDSGKLVIINTDTGKVVQALDTLGGADEIWFDAPTGRIYFSGYFGLAVVHQDDPDHYRLLARIPTGFTGKSGIWIPELKRYYAAVPEHRTQVMPFTQYGPGITEQARLLVLEALP